MDTFTIKNFDAKVLVSKSSDESFYVVRWGKVWFYVIMDNKTLITSQHCGGAYETKAAYMANALHHAEVYGFTPGEVVDTFPRALSVRLSEGQIAALGYLALQATTPAAVKDELALILKQVR